MELNLDKYLLPTNINSYIFVNISTKKYLPILCFYKEIVTQNHLNTKTYCIEIIKNYKMLFIQNITRDNPSNRVILEYLNNIHINCKCLLLKLNYIRFSRILDLKLKH